MDHLQFRVSVLAWSVLITTMTFQNGIGISEAKSKGVWNSDVPLSYLAPAAVDQLKSQASTIINSTIPLSLRKILIPSQHNAVLNSSYDKIQSFMNKGTQDDGELVNNNVNANLADILSGKQFQNQDTASLLTPIEIESARTAPARNAELTVELPDLHIEEIPVVSKPHHNLETLTSNTAEHDLMKLYLKFQKDSTIHGEKFENIIPKYPLPPNDSEIQPNRNEQQLLVVKNVDSPLPVKLPMELPNLDPSSIQIAIINPNTTHRAVEKGNIVFDVMESGMSDVATAVSANVKRVNELFEAALTEIKNGVLNNRAEIKLEHENKVKHLKKNEILLSNEAQETIFSSRGMESIACLNGAFHIFYYTLFFGILFMYV